MLIRLANLDDPWDQQAVVELLDMYAQDSFGDGMPLAPDVRRDLIPGLRQQPGCRAFLAIQDQVPVGLALCFLGYSSFRAKPLLNIHDLAVVPQCRGQGVGRAMLKFIEEEARRCGCCRLTLEVRSDNHRASGLYRDFGFQCGDDPTHDYLFLKKPIGKS